MQLSFILLLYINTLHTGPPANQTLIHSLMIMMSYLSNLLTLRFYMLSLIVFLDKAWLEQMIVDFPSIMCSLTSVIIPFNLFISNFLLIVISKCLLMWSPRVFSVMNHEKATKCFILLQVVATVIDLLVAYQVDGNLCSDRSHQEQLLKFHLEVESSPVSKRLRLPAFLFVSSVLLEILMKVKLLIDGFLRYRKRSTRISPVQYRMPFSRMINDVGSHQMFQLSVSSLSSISPSLTMRPAVCQQFVVRSSSSAIHSINNQGAETRSSMAPIRSGNLTAIVLACIVVNGIVHSTKSISVVSQKIFVLTNRCVQLLICSILIFLSHL